MRPAVTVLGGHWLIQRPLLSLQGPLDLSLPSSCFSMSHRIPPPHTHTSASREGNLLVLGTDEVVCLVLGGQMVM